MKKRGLFFGLGSAIALIAIGVLIVFQQNQIKLKFNDVQVELGQSIDTDLSVYVLGKTEGAKLDVSKVDISQTGMYQASITKQKKNLPLTVHVIDTTPPTAKVRSNLSFPTNNEVKAKDLLEEIIDESKVVVTFLDGLEEHIYTEGGEIIEQLVLTDSSNNQSILETTFIVLADITKPKLKGTKDIKVYIGEEIEFLKGITATDDRDGDITSWIQVDTSKVDTSKLGNYQVVYSIRDSSDNVATKKRNVTILEDKKPVLHGVSDKWITLGEKIDFLNGITATDDRDGDITSLIEVDSSKVNLKKAGAYKITYTITDSLGNTTSATLQLTIKAPSTKSTKDTNSKTNQSTNKSSGSSKKEDTSSGFDWGDDPKPSGKMPNGDIPAGGKQGVGDWG